MLNEEVLFKVDSLCKEIELLVRVNQPNQVEYFEQKALQELYVSVLAFMHYYTLRTFGGKNGNEKI